MLPDAIQMTLAASFQNNGVLTEHTHVASNRSNHGQALSCRKVTCCSTDVLGVAPETGLPVLENAAVCRLPREFDPETGRLGLCPVAERLS